MATGLKQAFTGRHMALVLISFFGVVVGVNLLMANLAVGTFGGTVVANSYVASQHFNDWLAEGRRQAALGWQVTAVRDGENRLELTAVDRAGQPIDGLAVMAAARHPVGLAETRSLTLHRDGDAYRSTAPLPAGRWLVKFSLNGADGAFQMESEIR